MCPPSSWSIWRGKAGRLSHFSRLWGQTVPRQENNSQIIQEVVRGVRGLSVLLLGNYCSHWCKFLGNRYRGGEWGSTDVQVYTLPGDGRGRAPAQVRRCGTDLSHHRLLPILSYPRCKGWLWGCLQSVTPLPANMLTTPTPAAETLLITAVQPQSRGQLVISDSVRPRLISRAARGGHTGSCSGLSRTGLIHSSPLPPPPPPVTRALTFHLLY